MRLLLTRPAAESRRFAAELTPFGIDCQIDPMLTVETLPVDLPALDAYAALAVTSGNGAAALAALTGRRDLPVYAVGAKTAARLTAAGFAEVREAGGDVAALSALLAARPPRGPVLYASGADVAHPLDAAGVRIDRCTVYRAVAAASLAPETVAALCGGRLDGVVFFSPRTARVFARLARDAAAAAVWAHLDAFCLSAAVAAGAADLPWRSRPVAARPDAAAMIALLKQHAVLTQRMPD